jgi:Asp-tRNA(Asn)/Glu-tRNA(Gln) amidotransferase A subunit family amidase
LQEEKAMGLDEVCTGSLGDAARLIARREVSPVELTRAMLARIERLDGNCTAT